MSVSSASAALTWHESRVEAVVRRTPRAVSVFFGNPLGLHRAGQHVDVRLVAEDGYEARRSYSIASAPGNAQIELLVERLDDGEVSPFFNDVVRPGDSIELLGPIGGHFVWTGDNPAPLLLIAGGSGIAPLMAILRHRAAIVPRVEALLVYSARTWCEMAFVDELIEMEAGGVARSEAGGRFRLAIATTREAPRRDGDFGHRIDRPMLSGLLRQWGHVPGAVYVCGSTGFVETANAALLDEGVPAAIIGAERYGGA